MAYALAPPLSVGSAVRLKVRAFFANLLCTEEGTLNTSETIVYNSFDNLSVLQTLLFLPLSPAVSIDLLYAVFLLGHKDYIKSQSRSDIVREFCLENISIVILVENFFF